MSGFTRINDKDWQETAKPVACSVTTLDPIQVTGYVSGVPAQQDTDRLRGLRQVLAGEYPYTLVSAAWPALLRTKADKFEMETASKASFRFISPLLRARHDCGWAPFLAGTVPVRSSSLSGPPSGVSGGGSVPHSVEMRTITSKFMSLSALLTKGTCYV